MDLFQALISSIVTVTLHFLQRNSLELDESFGILSPGEMKDFTLSSSMTQSFASVTSLPRDISCEDLDSSSADKTVTEEYIYEDPSPFTSIKSGRFCLDSSKLEEIEALTGSPPLSNLVEVPVLSDISEMSELSETQPIAPLPAEPLPQPQHSIDSVSDILNERTEKLLKNSSNISKRPRKKKASPKK